MGQFMEETKKVIYFNYSVKDSFGNPIDTSSGKTVSILEGAKQTFPVIESAMLVAPLKEKQTIPVKSIDAYGEYKNSLLTQVSGSKFKKKPNIGSSFKVKLPGDKIVVMTVVDKKDDIYILDGNHPLAGTDLVFEIEVIRRRPAQEFEIQSGQVRPEE